MSGESTSASPTLAELGLDTSDAARSDASRDFGGLTRGSATGVVSPRTREELAAVVRAAAAHGDKLTPRGQGLSQSGQSVPRGGISLNLRGLARLDEPNLDARTVTVEPGATFRELLARLAPHGLRPPVMPLNLDLSIGGVLSVGGFGSTSFRHGVVAGNVASVEVVSGTGEVVVATRERSQHVFDAVLGGLGRAGVIARAELELVATRPRTLTAYLLYETCDALLRDMLALSRRSDVQHLEGFCAASLQGLALGPSGRREPFMHWQYGLQVSSEIDAAPGSALTTPEFMRDASPARVLKLEHDDTLAFAARYDGRFEMMRKTGAWSQLHPWFECLLPVDRAAELIPQALTHLPFFLGDGHRILLLPAGSHPAAVAFPAGDPVVGFAVLPVGVPEPMREPALAALKALHERFIAAGAKRYPSGWLFEPHAADWRRHYAAHYDTLVRTRAELDPRGVFESCLDAPPAG